MREVVFPRDRDEGDEKNEENSEHDEGESNEKIMIPNNPMDPKLRIKQCNNPNHNNNINNSPTLR